MNAESRHGTDHNGLALGEVQNTRRANYHRKAKRDEAIDTTQRYASDHEIQKLGQAYSSRFG